MGEHGRRVRPRSDVRTRRAGDPNPRTALGDTLDNARRTPRHPHPPPPTPNPTAAGRRGEKRGPGPGPGPPRGACREPRHEKGGDRTGEQLPAIADEEVVSITPTANLSPFSGTAARGRWTRTAMPRTSARTRRTTHPRPIGRAHSHTGD